MDYYEVEIKHQIIGYGDLNDRLKHCVHQQCERPLEWHQLKQGHNSKALTAYCRNCGTTYNATVIT